MVAKEKVIERISSITASMASTPTPGGGATSGVTSVASTGKAGNAVTASPAA
jgi:formiminotetrahydrofolate cyclodeaminase